MLHYRPSLHSHSSPTAVTIGNFDGVHLGHAAVLRRLVALARERSLTPTVLTFAPNPKVYFAHLRDTGIPKQILPLRDKIAALQQLGIERVVILPFDAHLANMSADTFVRDILAAGLNTRLLLVGDDFRFGAKRQGDFALLDSLKNQYGYALANIHSVVRDEVRISSSHIRALIAAGNMHEVAQWLGHPLQLSGHIIHGQKLGRTIGVPTINLKMPTHLATQGVFAATVRLSGKPEQLLHGAASIGVRPSVHSNGQCWCEVHLFDFDEQVYGQIAKVQLHHKIRDEAKFTDFDELVRVIQQDIQACREYFAGQSQMP